jgi:hypothetical protein
VTLPDISPEGFNIPAAEGGESTSQPPLVIKPSSAGEIIIEIARASNDTERTGSESDEADIELRIAELERKNEIHTPAERLLEASLLIEPTFLYPAIITGQSADVEYAFGKEQWANYLGARLLTKSYQGPLTIDFVLDVYGCLLGKYDYDEVVEDTRLEEGHLGVGAQAGQPTAMTCNESEVAIINANPYLEWLSVTQPNNDVDAFELSEIHPIGPYLLAKHGWAVTNVPSALGFINYVVKTKDEKLRELVAIGDQYNKIRDLPYDPDELAASLEHWIVSLHAGRDYNGTASRLLMNWSLERDSLGPSIPYPDDLLTVREQHVGFVRQGRILYEQSHQKVEAGETDPVVIFGLESERARFQENSVATPPKLEPGSLHEPAVFEGFLRAMSPKSR